MKSNYRLVKNILVIICMLLIQSCEREDPTVFSVNVVDILTGSEIPGITVLFSAYEKPPSFLTLPNIIRLDTIETDSLGHLRLVVPYNEQYSRFTLKVMKEVSTDTYEFINGKDCSPYDCGSFKAGNVYKFKLKIPLDSL